jgi:hypothetical protein
MQEQHEKIQREVVELKQQLKQQREYCTSHHVYDTTSPLVSADMILQAPASEADSAALGLLDLAQQVRGIACGCCFVTRAWMIADSHSDPTRHFWYDTVCSGCIRRQRAEERAGGGAAAARVCAGAFAAACSGRARPVHLRSKSPAFEKPFQRKTSLNHVSSCTPCVGRRISRH